MSFWCMDDPVMDKGRVVRGGMWEHQREWWNQDNHIKSLVAGYGCLRGSTKIHTENGLKCIADISQPERVLSWDGKRHGFQLSLSSGAFLKGTANLYRVVTTRGEFVSTGHHRIVSSSGRFERVDRLRVGQAVGIYAGIPLHSSGELYPLLLPSGDLHSMQTVADWMGHCANESRLCDQQPLRAVGDGIACTPSVSDAHRSALVVDLGGPSAHWGGREGRRQEHSRHAQSYGHAYKPRSFRQWPSHDSGGVDQSVALRSERTLYYRQPSGQSASMSVSRRNTEQRFFGAHSSQILSVERLIQAEDYYDLQVLNTNNYVTEDGCIHHNSGKTYIGAKRVIAAALKNATSIGFVPSLVVSPTYKLAKRTTIPTILGLLEGRAIHYNHNKSDNEIRINYKGLRNIIWIASGDDPQSLKGPNIGTVWLDEPFVMERGVLTESLARLRHPNAKLIEMIMTGTPESIGGWGYDIIEGDEKDNFDVGMVRASTRANQALQGDLYERLKTAYGSDEKMVRAYLEGEFVNFSKGLIYYGFDRKHHVVELPDPGGPLIAGMDFNVNPMAACVFWVRDGHMHYIDEIELPNSDTDEMCEELKRRYPGRLNIVYPDPTGKAGHASAPSGRSDFAVIQNHGFQIRARAPGKPTRRDRYNVTNALLKAGHLTMSRKCRKLARYMEQLAHETIRKQDDMTHLTTAATYGVEMLFPLPKPTAGRVARMSGI